MEYVIFAGLAVYLVPSFVAAARELPHTELLIALNLAFGWTGIGWLALLAWVILSPREPLRRRPRPHPHLHLLPGGRHLGRAH